MDILLSLNATVGWDLEKNSAELQLNRNSSMPSHRFLRTRARRRLLRGFEVGSDGPYHRAGLWAECELGLFGTGEDFGCC